MVSRELLGHRWSGWVIGAAVALIVTPAVLLSGQRAGDQAKQEFSEAAEQAGTVVDAARQDLLAEIEESDRVAREARSELAIQIELLAAEIDMLVDAVGRLEVENDRADAACPCPSPSPTPTD